DVTLHVLDLLAVRFAEAEGAGEDDVLWLAVAAAHPFRVADRGQAHLLALRVDDSAADAVHRDGVGGEEEALAPPAGARTRARAAFVDRLEAVENVESHLRADRREGDDRRDELAAGVHLRRGVAAGDVVDEAVRHVL